MKIQIWKANSIIAGLFNVFGWRIYFEGSDDDDDDLKINARKGSRSYTIYCESVIFDGTE